MSIEASLPMLLAIFGVSCSVFGVNTFVMGRLCRSKGIEMVKRNVIMGINCTKHPGEDAWDPTITAARLFEKAEKALLKDADAYFAQRAAQEALSLLKANERQIEQLHTLLEQEGSEDDR